jgi:D-alanyl-D-alanine carboxypeptidase
MLVKDGGRVTLDVDAQAEPADALVYRDYYTISAQIRLTAIPDDGMTGKASTTEVVLTDSDVARLVDCALRHPERNMRQAVTTAVWRDAETFREIFRLGLNPPPGFDAVAKIAAEELAKAGLAAAPTGKAGGGTLLPRMPVPEHLRDRK